MTLSTTAEMLRAARRNGYAIGAFNVHTLDLIPALAAAAEAEGAPVILQFTAATFGSLGVGNVAALGRHVAEQAGIPVALHLDHGRGLAEVREALAYGFTSVMIDASHLPFEENVALTREAVAAARAAGVPVEAELGHVGGATWQAADAGGSGAGGAPGAGKAADAREARTDPRESLTDPGDAARFVERTGVDSLAVSIGTQHGFYRAEPRLDLHRLAEIARRVPVPLVLHGGSGVPEAPIRRTIELGIAKINIATELKAPWAAATRKAFADHPDEIDPRKLLAPGREAVIAAARARIRLFGASGRAAAGR